MVKAYLIFSILVSFNFSYAELDGPNKDLVACLNEKLEVFFPIRECDFSQSIISDLIEIDRSCREDTMMKAMASAGDLSSVTESMKGFPEVANAYISSRVNGFYRQNCAENDSVLYDHEKQTMERVSLEFEFEVWTDS